MKALATLMIVAAAAAVGADRDQEEAAYYKGWVGCNPPTVSFDRSDRTNYVETSYKGKQVLLYSFDGGDFVNLPDEKHLTEQLQSLHRVRTNLRSPLLVIGYSRSILWNPVFGMKQLPKEIEEASHFPIINLNNKRDENGLPEPYKLLESLGGILIGTNGLICSVFLHEMTEEDFKSIPTIRAWEGPERSPPFRKTDKRK